LGHFSPQVLQALSHAAVLLGTQTQSLFAPSKLVVEALGPLLCFGLARASNF